MFEPRQFFSKTSAKGTFLSILKSAGIKAPGEGYSKQKIVKIAHLKQTGLLAKCGKSVIWWKSGRKKN